MAIGPTTIFQTVVRYKMWDEELQNVFHWRVETTGGNTDEVLVSNAFALELQADIAVAGTPLHDLLECITSDCEMIDVTVQVVFPIRTAFRRKVIGVPGVKGTNRFQNVQSTVTKRTNKAGRPYVGGIHIPPGGEADYIDGLLSPAFKTTVLTNSAWMYTDYTESTYGTVFRPVVFHGGTLLPPGDDVTNIEVQEQARVMVRRTKGRGI